MSDENQANRRIGQLFRAVAFLSVALLFLHIASLPILWGIESLFFYGAPEGFETLKTVLMFTGLAALASFCLSTQFYIASIKPKR